MLTHFSLFSGVEGIGLAAKWAGFTTVGLCEIDPFCQKVLRKHWPDVPIWGDVRDVTRESIRERGIKKITLLSGGFPCQPHSLAGKRKASLDERDLWGEFARVICEVKPRWVLGENVPGLLTSDSGRFFGRILRDLAGMGYSVGWCCYGADKVGAIHKRERVFIVAHSNSEYVEGRSTDQVQRVKEIQGKFHSRSITEWRERCTIHQPKLCRTFNGLPHQVDRIRCLGNAVVPQQIYPILKCIAEIERESD